MAKKFKCHYCGSPDFITQEQEDVLYFYEWDKKRKRYIYPPDHIYLQTGQDILIFCRKCGRQIEYEKMEDILFNEIYY